MRYTFEYTQTQKDFQVADNLLILSILWQFNQRQKGILSIEINKHIKAGIVLHICLFLLLLLFSKRHHTVATSVSNMCMKHIQPIGTFICHCTNHFEYVFMISVGTFQTSLIRVTRWKKEGRKKLLNLNIASQRTILWAEINSCLFRST